MRVRVELRRKDGALEPRYGPQREFTGQLMVMRREIHDRWIQFLTMRTEPRQGFPNDLVAAPALFEPRLLDTHDDIMRFTGWEVVDGRSWHVQEWDCYFLPQ